MQINVRYSQATRVKLLKLSVPLFLFVVLNAGNNALDVLHTIQCHVLLKLNSTQEKTISPEQSDVTDQSIENNKQKPESLKLTCIIVIIQNSFLLESLQLQHHGLDLRKTDS